MKSGITYGSIRIGESYGLRSMLSTGTKIKAKNFTWYDTGTIANLKKARKAFARKSSPNILEKPNEAIWFVNNRVIKYSEDSEFIKDRQERAKHLTGYVPKIVDVKDYMYTYKFVGGTTMSRVITKPLFEKFLFWIDKFCEKMELNSEEKKEF